MGTEVRELRIRIEFNGGDERRTRLLVDDGDGQPPLELYQGEPLRENRMMQFLAPIISNHILHLEADAMLAVLAPLVDIPAYVDFGPKKGFG